MENCYEKKKIDDLKLTSKQSSEVINTMFSRLSAVERNRLNMIDNLQLTN